MADRLSDLERRVAVNEAVTAALDKHADERHGVVMSAIGDLRGAVEELRKAVAPVGVESTPASVSRDGAIRFSLRPSAVQKWLPVVLPILAALAGWGAHGAADMAAEPAPVEAAP